MSVIRSDDDEFTWNVHLGGAEVLEMTYQDENGTPIDLSGMTLETYDEAEELEGHLQSGIHEPRAAGRFWIKLLPSANPPLRISRPFRFRLIPAAGINSAISFPVIKVVAR